MEDTLLISEIISIYIRVLLLFILTKTSRGATLLKAREEFTMREEVLPTMRRAVLIGLALLLGCAGTREMRMVEDPFPAIMEEMGSQIRGTLKGEAHLYVAQSSGALWEKAMRQIVIVDINSNSSRAAVEERFWWSLFVQELNLATHTDKKWAINMALERYGAVNRQGRIDDLMLILSSSSP